MLYNWPSARRLNSTLANHLERQNSKPPYIDAMSNEFYNLYWASVPKGVLQLFFWGDKSGCMFSAEVRQENFNKLQNGKNPGDHLAQPIIFREEMKPGKGCTAMEAGPLAISISPAEFCAKLFPQAFGLLVGFLWSCWLDNQTTRYIAWW